MTRTNYHLQDDANFPVGVETHFPVRHRLSAMAVPGSVPGNPFGMSGAFLSTAPSTTVSAVTQGGGVKTTGVTLSRPNGNITTDPANIAAATIVSFTLTNTLIAIGDVLLINHVSGGTGGAYTINAQCGAGSAVINIRNNTAGGLAEAIVISFQLIKSPFQPTFPLNVGANATWAAGTSVGVGPVVTVQTGTTSGDSGLLMTSFDQTRRDWNPDLQIVYQPNAANLTSVRHWCGLFSADPSTKADLTTATAVQGVAFGYDTVVDTGGVFWAIATCDGTTQQRILLDGTGNKPAFPIAAGITYVLRIRCDIQLGVVDFYGATVSSANGVGPMVKMGSFSTNLPTSTLALGAGGSVTVLPTTPALKKMSIGRIQLSQN